MLLINFSVIGSGAFGLMSKRKQKQNRRRKASESKRRADTDRYRSREVCEQDAVHRTYLLKAEVSLTLRLWPPTPPAAALDLGGVSMCLVGVPPPPPAEVDKSLTVASGSCSLPTSVDGALAAFAVVAVVVAAPAAAVGAFSLKGSG